MTQFIDIADHDEDERVAIIGHQVMDHKKVVSFMVDDDPGKADRYIRKLQSKHPGLRVIQRGKGPVDHVEYVKVGPPVQ